MTDELWYESAESAGIVDPAEPEIRFYRAVGTHAFLSNLFRRMIEFEDHFSLADGIITPLPPLGVDKADLMARALAAGFPRAFRSAEDVYQYGKPRRREVAEWLVAAPSPHLCAMAAHALFVYDVRRDWAAIKVDRMREVLRAKFSQHADLRALLLVTRRSALVEESSTDAFWGVGAKGTGQNMLGKLLMELRDVLRRLPVDAPAVDAPAVDAPAESAVDA